MLAIFLVWVVNLTIVTALGSILQILVFKDDRQSEYLLFNGLFAYMILIWIYLYFTGFGLYWQMLSFILALLYLILQPKYVKILWQSFKDLAFHYKIIFVLISLVALMLSSAYAFLPDNESYYIQTVKWANEQGFIRGLMNVHPFLGQFSGWHILQAGFNFPFGLITFNDLNALFFLIFSFYWLKNYGTQQPSKYWLSLLPVTAVVYVFFIADPAPDLSVILLSLIVFDLFIKNYKKADANSLLQMLLIASFSFLIKPTAVINLVLELILLWKHRKKLKPKKLFITTLIILTIIFWLTKNYIITGYIFYPFDVFAGLFKPAWQYPQILMEYMGELGRRDHLALNANNGILTSFWMWLTQAGWRSIIHILFVFLLIFYPLVLWLKKKEIDNIKPYWLLYSLGLFYFVIILFIAPNFRFFMMFGIFFALTVKTLLGNPKFYKLFNSTGVVLFLIAGVLLAIRNNFDEKNLIIPKPVSKLNYRFIKNTEAGFEYYYPDDPDLFWETGDAPLPAVHKNQVKFFKEKFNLVPQKDNSAVYYYQRRP